jgi:two-component system LytT family response regulator
MRVLIVDDEPLARQRLRHLLAEIPGTEVVGECGDGTDAARAIGDLAPDVVLLDVQMREMGGFALVDAVGAGRMPPVVFVTAHDQFALRAFDVSAVDYLLKPVQAPQLARALQRAAERRRATDPALRGNLRALLETVRTMLGEAPAAPASAGSASERPPVPPGTVTFADVASTCAPTPCTAAASPSRCLPAGTRCSRRWSRGRARSSRARSCCARSGGTPRT